MGRRRSTRAEGFAVRPIGSSGSLFGDPSVVIGIISSRGIPYDHQTSIVAGGCCGRVRLAGCAVSHPAGVQQGDVAVGGWYTIETGLENGLHRAYSDGTLPAKVRRRVPACVRVVLGAGEECVCGGFKHGSVMIRGRSFLDAPTLGCPRGARGFLLIAHSDTMVVPLGYSIGSQGTFTPPHLGPGGWLDHRVFFFGTPGTTIPST